MDTNSGNGNGERRRYRRLPDNLNGMLAGWVMQLYRIIQAAEDLYGIVDPDTAIVIKQLVEAIIKESDDLMSDIRNETEELKDLMIELRDLRDFAAQCGEQDGNSAT